MGKIGQGIQAGVGILVLAGGIGAFYVFNHDPALKQRLLQDVDAEDKPAPQPPANAPVGFNAARTAFVLPHRLGYLPAPELALAKSDPAYAAGLANLGDWYHYAEAGVMEGGPTQWYWLYDSGLTHYGGAISLKLTIEDTLNDPSKVVIRDQVMTTPVRVHSYVYRVLTNPYVPSDVVPEYVAPTVLEVVAAPIRATSSAGPGGGAVCVPSPLAFLQNGRVYTPTGLSPLTAGPSVVFFEGPTRGDDAGLADQGVPSCNRFS